MDSVAIRPAVDPGTTLADLAAHPRWVAWCTEQRGTRATKVPYSPAGRRASSTNPEHWGTRAAAEDAFRRIGASGANTGGVGIVLGQMDHRILAGVDLDTCRDPDTGKLADWAAEICEKLATYTEVSPSKQGVKLFFVIDAADVALVREAMDIARGQNGRRWSWRGSDHPPGIEVYLSGRYFAVTDQRLHGAPETLRSIPVAILAWLINDAVPRFKAIESDAEYTHGAAAPAVGQVGEGDLMRRLDATLVAYPMLASRWNGDVAGLSDTSRSGLAFALGSLLKRAGFPLDDTCTLLRQNPHTQSWVIEKGDAGGGRELRRIWERAGKLDVEELGTGTTASHGDAAECPYAGGRFVVRPGGVVFVGVDADGAPQPDLWLCSPLRVTAKTRDATNAEWGRLLEWRDDDGVPHRWAMPLELLEGDGIDVRKELARQGVHIATGKKAREFLAAYLKAWRVEDRARCVDRLGWHGTVYATPMETIGVAGEHVVFQNAHAVEPALSASGTVEQWRDSVAGLAAGNSRLVFAICVALAGPLIGIAAEDSGGFHLRGASSTGKSTALKAAASVWGHPSTYPRVWRATANGLEGLAALHNDGLLILDELSQMDPREVGEAAYLLANGQGKSRASRSGAARQSASWRLFFLSAGEESLAALMAQGGKRATAGQEVRLADIEADAGAGMGAFEQIHGHQSASGFALALKDAATAHHGAIGLQWLRCIVGDRASLASVVADGVARFLREALTGTTASQAQRVARRFALVAVAGELATRYGLTGWPPGEAESASRKCFTAWLDAFGGASNREERALLAQVRAFLETHGASRFEDMASPQDWQRVINRAGFYRSNPSGWREFMVLPEAFKREVCNGFEPKWAARTLISGGWICPGGDGRPTQKIRLPGLGSSRVYVFTEKVWEADL